MMSRTVFALLMTAAFAASASAQSAPTATQPASNQTAKQDKRTVTTAQQPAAPKSAPTRAEKKPATATSRPAEHTVPHTASNTPHDGKKEVPRIQSDPLARVTVDKQGSTFGFSSDTKMNMYATPDGQRIRGLDSGMTSTRQPNYFGLSLSVPTTGTSSGDGPPGLFPLPPRP